MTALRFRVDRRAFAVAEVRKATAAAVEDATEFLLEEANRTAPIEEGSLIRSGTASTAGVKGAVSYDTPYAVRQHEDTRLRHDAGRRAKWLEHTFREQQKSVGEFIAGKMREAL